MFVFARGVQRQQPAAEVRDSRPARAHSNFRSLVRPSVRSAKRRARRKRRARCRAKICPMQSQETSHCDGGGGARRKWHAGSESRLKRASASAFGAFDQLFC